MLKFEEYSILLKNLWFYDLLFSQKIELSQELKLELLEINQKFENEKLFHLNLELKKLKKWKDHVNVESSLNELFNQKCETILKFSKLLWKNKD